MKKIMAKSKQNNQNEETLIEHIESLLFVLEKILQNMDFKYINEKVVEKIVINFKGLLKDSCILHDLGKINIKMQERLSGEKVECVRHNILTGAFLKVIFESLYIEEDIKLIMYKSLILHHGSYNQYLDINRASIEESVYFHIKEAILDKNIYDIKAIEDYINNKLNINIKFKENILDYDFMDKFNEDFRGIKEYHYIYIMLKGFLNLIDHLASTQIKDFEYYLPYGTDELDKRLIEHIKDKSKLDKVDFKELQKTIGNYTEENVLTQAFTGSGKTVADYRWHSKRKIFLVPNKISAESFYNDATQILGVDNIGILHGDISLYVNDESNKHEGMELSLKDKNLSRNFAKPYIIATVDQLLLAMFKYPGYERIFASIYNTNITVDEVHLLDPRMYLILLYFIQFSNNFLNTNFHLMTATLPKIYKNKLEELNINFIESNKNEEVEENKKIKLNILKNEEKEILNIVEKEIKKASKILVVKNTVNEAINTFELLNKNLNKDKKLQINLLHSRYKFEDKCKKYKEILAQKGDIWVSTQGVEISLDLDFQTVISDNAPLESIIQRMGRCNRHNTLEYGEFYVLDECKNDVYDQGLKKVTLKQLKKLKNKILSMKDRKNELDNYYDLKEVNTYFEKEFESAIRIIKSIYGIKDNNLDGEKIIFNYEPYLNIVDNKKEASKLFRGNNTSVKVILEEDYKLLSTQKASYKDYQIKSIQISSNIYYVLKENKAIYIKDGYIVIRDEHYNYSYEKGLGVKYKNN